MTDGIDDDALVAAVDLVGRAGAHQFEVGYLNDGVPVAEADWYAHAQYQGRRIIVEHHTGPVEAAEALALRVLTGAKCGHCGALVALNDDGAFAFDSAEMADGTRWTAEEAAAAGQCRWRRVGRRWVRGCDGGVGGGWPNRAARRRRGQR